MYIKNKTLTDITTDKQCRKLDVITVTGLEFSNKRMYMYVLYLYNSNKKLNKGDNGRTMAAFSINNFIYFRFILKRRGH